MRLTLEPSNIEEALHPQLGDLFIHCSPERRLRAVGPTRPLCQVDQSLCGLEIRYTKSTPCNRPVTSRCRLQRGYAGRLPQSPRRDRSGSPSESRNSAVSPGCNAAHSAVSGTRRGSPDTPWGTVAPPVRYRRKMSGSAGLCSAACQMPDQGCPSRPGPVRRQCQNRSLPSTFPCNRRSIETAGSPNAADSLAFRHNDEFPRIPPVKARRPSRRTELPPPPNASPKCLSAPLWRNGLADSYSGHGDPRAQPDEFFGQVAVPKAPD